MKRPDIGFFVIGAARSGTTSLYRALGRHPSIFTPTVKEPRFFAENKKKGWEWYSGLYADAPLRSVLGDFSPNYTNTSGINWIAPKMHRAYPDAKLIYMVRNPIACAISNWRMTADIMGESVPFGDCFDNSWSYSVYHRVCYFRQISPFREHYPDDQILVVPLELMRQDSDTWMNKIYNHIGVDPIETVFPKANASDRKESRPPAPEISLAERQKFYELVWPDTRKMLAYIGQPESLWTMGPNASAWEPKPLNT